MSKYLVLVRSGMENRAGFQNSGLSISKHAAPNSIFARFFDVTQAMSIRPNAAGSTSAKPLNFFALQKHESRGDDKATKPKPAEENNLPLAELPKVQVEAACRPTTSPQSAKLEQSMKLDSQSHLSNSNSNLENLNQPRSLQYTNADNSNEHSLNRLTSKMTVENVEESDSGMLEDSSKLEAFQPSVPSVDDISALPTEFSAFHRRPIKIKVSNSSRTAFVFGLQNYRKYKLPSDEPSNCVFVETFTVAEAVASSPSLPSFVSTLKKYLKLQRERNIQKVVYPAIAGQIDPVPFTRQGCRVGFLDAKLFLKPVRKSDGFVLYNAQVAHRTFV